MSNYNHDSMKKSALVIGINQYQTLEHLEKCENDATDISNFLIKCNFKVKLLLNPNQREIISALAQYKKEVTEDSISIIYFSGHGIQIENSNFIVPADANITITEEIPYFCVNASDLLLDINIQSKIMHLIILDACRNNPFKSGNKSLSAGLARMIAPMGTLIAFSTSPNMTSVERKNEHNGIYTKHLLNNLKVPNISIERMFKNTRTDVLNDTSGKQIPWEESSLHGEDYIFVKESTALKMYLKKELIFAQNELMQNEIEFNIITENNLDTLKLPFSKATKLFLTQFEEYKETISPRDAFTVLFNLQKLIYATYLFSSHTRLINFREIDREIIHQSPNLPKDEIMEYQKILLTMEHYSSIFGHNDKFGNLKSIKRTIKKNTWIGFKLDNEILKNQHFIMDDFTFLKENIEPMNEIINCDLLIEVLEEFFNK